MNKYRFTIIGGDRRMVSLAKFLVARGHIVAMCLCCDEASQLSDVSLRRNLPEAIASAEILVLPMPISRDGSHIITNLPSEESPLLCEVLRHAKNSDVRHILGGNITEKIRSIANDEGVQIFDYSLSERFLQRNAEATAEGSIMIAMENIDRTLGGSDILIGGFGRIGKYLAKLLCSMGARVWIAARRQEVLEEIISCGYKGVDLNDTDALRGAIRECGLIFNTVPSLIFRGEHFTRGIKNTYIELASCPGGIDLRSAREIGVSVIFAPSLPGRCFPDSAGEYIFESICKSLEKEDINV